ncbi:MAG TPA: hypothetical protein VME17_19135 [Bryobacteraceae bacterium]|nr:hypothetical protein [Bryobacteraceae bacterium]
MFRLFFASFPLLICALFVPEARAALTCTPSTTPAIVHGEGISERTGDIVFTCSGGAPNATLTANLFIFLNVSITNRLTSAASGVFTGLELTADNGSGPQPLNATATQAGQATLVFNGATFTLSPSGTVTLTLAGLRGAANELDFAANSTMQVIIGLNPTQIFGLSSNQLTVGIPEHGLYDAFSTKIVCSQSGSPLPADTTSFASFLASRAVFSSTRVTEGYADSFGPLSAWQNMNADTGTRIIVQYSGFPSGAQLFVPTVVAGSDATKPTAGGDLGLPASGGQYTPGGNPSLLLSLVQNTDANGAGGTPLYTPGAPGSGTVSFDAMSPVTLTNGSGIAVYQVMDANPSIQESAQFPTFLALSPFSGAAVQTNENVSLAPVSTVYTATAKDPIPRFQQIQVPADCTIVGDCNASYFPRLSVVQSSLSFTAAAGGQTQTQYMAIQNASGGVLQWNASLTYTNGSGWLNVSPTSGQNSSEIRVDAIPGTLAPGTYNAILTINAGPLAGTSNVPVTLVITPANSTVPAVQPPAVTAIANAATFAAGAVAPGSIASLGGTQLSGKTVTVTFNGLPAQTLFDNATQINLIVPAALGVQSSAQVVVTVDGTASAPFTVNLVPFAPGIFANGVLNQDYSVNSSKQPAAPGSIIQIFATGLSGTGVITAKIGNQTVAQPYYGGPAPGLSGVQQVDLIVPSDLTGNTVNVSVCGGPTAAQVVCSPPVGVAISQ